MTIEQGPKQPRKPAASSRTDAARATPLAAHPVPPRHGPDIGMPQALRSHHPDRATRAFLRMLNLVQSFIPQKRIPLKAQRQVVRLAGLAYGRRPDVAEVTERAIAGPGGQIELRVFTPTRESRPRPAFLWCHGGGFVVGGLDTADSICRQIARQANCIAIAVRYRLAPEHDLVAGDLAIGCCKGADLDTAGHVEEGRTDAVGRHRPDAGRAAAPGGRARDPAQPQGPRVPGLAGAAGGRDAEDVLHRRGTLSLYHYHATASTRSTGCRSCS